MRRDKLAGRKYKTAANKEIVDEGLKVLQGKFRDEPNICVTTRVAKVRRPLMAVTGMVDKGHTVVFDSEGSLALNKKTGRKIPFSRHAGGWDLKLDLEPPETANETTKHMLAELASAFLPFGTEPCSLSMVGRVTWPGVQTRTSELQ